MLVLGEGAVVHSTIRELPERLPPSLFVVNDTRVLPARLLGEKETGGRVELLLIERTSPPGTVERWSALGRASKPIREGSRLDFGPLRARVIARREGHLEVEIEGAAPIAALLEEAGHVPLPPYIRRADDELDRERYQTVFATAPGAVAAPTAGLHFSESLVSAMEDRGHRFARVTLHVGPGTFRPVTAERVDDHRMHAERFVRPEATLDAIADAKRDRRPVVAVGTTVVRTLESAPLSAGPGDTSLFILPGFELRVVDALLTNFHLPRSTLLALVMAFAGVEEVRAAYAEAVRARYRFFSYGDAMLIEARR
jgi:S-adenosylmethionine:tRNA ribosyltransferase-isomerase